MALPSTAATAATGAARRPPSLLLAARPAPCLVRQAPRRAIATFAARPTSSADSGITAAPPCDIEQAYYFVPSPAAVREAAASAAAAAAAAAARKGASSSSAASASSSTTGASTGGNYYGGTPPDSPRSSSSSSSSSTESASPPPSSFWDAVGHLAARAAEAAAPQVVLIPDALPPEAARAVARECRALKPRLAPELNCIASGRLGCYLTARSATHAALADPELARRLTRRLRSASPLQFSDYPMELRHYPKGSSMPWHSDEALYAEPQWELIYTVENDSDSETEWRDAAGRLHGAWTPPGSLLCVRAEGWQHRVSPVRRGSRLIVKLAYTVRGAAMLPSFAQNLGRAAYDRS